MSCSSSQRGFSRLFIPALGAGCGSGMRPCAFTAGAEVGGTSQGIRVGSQFLFLFRLFSRGFALSAVSWVCSCCWEEGWDERQRVIGKGLCGSLARGFSSWPLQFYYLLNSSGVSASGLFLTFFHSANTPKTVPLKPGSSFAPLELMGRYERGGVCCFCCSWGSA